MIKMDDIIKILEKEQKEQLIDKRYRLPIIQQQILMYLKNENEVYQTILEYKIKELIKKPFLNKGSFLAHIECLQELEIIYSIYKERGHKAIILRDRYKKGNAWRMKFPLTKKLREIMELFKDRDFIHPNEIQRYALTAKNLEFLKILEEIGLIKEIWQKNVRFYKLKE